MKEDYTEVDQSKLPNYEEIMSFIEEASSPILKEYLYRDEAKEYSSNLDKLREILQNYLKECKGIAKEHVHVEVTATPKQIKEGKYTVLFIAMDKYGSEILSKMKGLR